MPNVNISVPTELRKAMLDRTDINWSKIAQKAFVEELEKPKRDIIAISTKGKQK